MADERYGYDGEPLPSDEELTKLAENFRQQQLLGEAVPVLPGKAKPQSRPPEFGISPNRFEK